MSSLKMTFSLASLVLILGLIAMPVMAQEDMANGLTSSAVTIGSINGEQHAASRGRGRSFYCYCQ